MRCGCSNELCQNLVELQAETVESLTKDAVGELCFLECIGP